MAAFCPDLIYRPDPEAGGSWSGPITPIKSTERLLDLLDDIHHNNAVYMASGAELRHLRACGKTHCKHPWMEGIQPEDFLRTFDARITYSGGRDDPRCWITGIDLTNGRHMWTDGSICPFLSSSNTWNWMVDTVTDFAGHVAVFLVSWVTFQRTGAWIVGEHSISGTYHLNTIRPYDLCWCRSGRKYRKCHMRQDQALAWRGR